MYLLTFRWSPKMPVLEITLSIFAKNLPSVTSRKVSLCSPKVFSTCDLPNCHVVDNHQLSYRIKPKMTTLTNLNGNLFENVCRNFSFSCFFWPNQRLLKPFKQLVWVYWTHSFSHRKKFPFFWNVSITYLSNLSLTTIILNVGNTSILSIGNLTFPK